MASSSKYQNISVQPTTVPRTAKTVYELPRQNLTKDELERKSTSDRTKRRVAHTPWFPLPVITKPLVEEKPARKQTKKLVFKKDGVCLYHYNIINIM
ncbi:unnamed protein product [Macrosiphum euphorbiae]|uniref:Uncharacterized protein n=1 Tax=Macrosiphum euphorbiae TaxID=13131 RepID=A0AAV0X2P5_9HEMI|nr:unnamed protein product [Macrosiphum euphorbiae]